MYHFHSSNLKRTAAIKSKEKSGFLLSFISARLFSSKKRKTKTKKTQWLSNEHIFFIFLSLSLILWHHMAQWLADSSVGWWACELGRTNRQTYMGWSATRLICGNSGMERAKNKRRGMFLGRPTKANSGSRHTTTYLFFLFSQFAQLKTIFWKVGPP